MAAVPGSRGTCVRADEPLPVQGGAQPVVPHVAFDDVGDRGLEDHLDGLGVAAEQLLERGPVRGVADPGVAVSGAEGPADAVEQRPVGPVAVDISRRQLGQGSRAAVRVLPQGDR